MTSTALSLPPLDLRGTRDRSNLIVVALAVAIFSALVIWCALASSSDIEMDATTHYMIARFALKDPSHIVSVWGRPLCTAMYVIPAVLGRQVGTRIMSLFMALIIAAVTYRIARGQKMKYPALAVVLLFGQPLFFFHSWSSLTEIPFALFLSLAFWMYQRRNFLAMAILISFTPLGRPEGFGFVLIAAFALVVHRRWFWLFILPVPFLAWNYAGFVVEGRPWDQHWWMWVKNHWPYSGDSMYAKGPLVSYVVRLPALVGPFAFPFVLFGAAVSLWAGGLRPRTWKSPQEIAPDPDLAGPRWRPPKSVVDLIPRLRRRLDAIADHGILRWFLVPSNHLTRCKVWIAILPLLILIAHSLLHWLGKMGSSGELRYLVLVAPFWALLAAQGVEWFCTRCSFRFPFRWAGVGALLPLLANWHDYRGVGTPRGEFPFPRYAEDYIATAVAKWYRSDPQLQKDYPRVVSTPPGVWLRLDMSIADQDHVGIGGRQGTLHPLPGTVLVWDEVYGNTNSSADMVMPYSDIEKGGWIYIGRYECSDKWAEVFLSPLNARGAKTVWNKPTPTLDTSND